MSVHEICSLSFRTFHSEKYADDYNKGQESHGLTAAWTFKRIISEGM